jgi:hypothetical protein
MTTINPSPLFHGSFTYNGEQYANFASAVAAQGSDCRFRAYTLEDEFDKLFTQQPTVECEGYASPSGQFYAVVNVGGFDVRVDCANIHTLRKWISQGVTTKTFLEALQNKRNIRDAGGWAA